MKKSKVTQDLVNIYPEWAKVRSDDQSVGFQLLNALALPMEDLDKQLEDMRHNQYLTTANIDEIDLTYTVQLPVDFTFDLDTTDPFNPSPIAPTVSGEVINSLQSGYVDVTLAGNNDVRSLWYTSVPNRVSYENTASGVFELIDLESQDFPWSGNVEHHLEKGGRIWIEMEDGLNYIQINERGELDRSQIVIHGTTRKGTVESESFIFPWDQKQPSLKEWQELDKVDLYNVPSGIEVSIRSADFNHGPYQSFYNLAVSDNRNKVDEFWDISDDGSLLQRIGYVSDEWQQLILGFSSKEVKEQWSLLDSDWNTISGADLKVQPFQDRAWVVTSDGTLYCYDLDSTMPSGIDDLASKTPGSEVQLEIENRRVVKGEDILLEPLHVRPLQEIVKHRTWYEDPTGTKYGTLLGGSVSYSSNFWVDGPNPVQRRLVDKITINANQYGEYLFVTEALMADGTTHVDRQIVQVQSKLPLTEISLPNSIMGVGLNGITITGLDFDSDQKLWIRTSNNHYYCFGLLTDKMLIDYDNKIIYFKESYNRVKIL